MLQGFRKAVEAGGKRNAKKVEEVPSSPTRGPPAKLPRLEPQQELHHQQQLTSVMKVIKSDGKRGRHLQNGRFMSSEQFKEMRGIIIRNVRPS